jgi:integrase
MRRPFQINGRAGWHAEYVFADGQKSRLSFADKEAGQAWLDEQKALNDALQGPLFGGPARITLGQFLGEYAQRFSIGKQGYATEIDRINHYVTEAGLPRLKPVKEANGNRKLMTVADDLALPSAFQAHRDARMAQRAQTYAWIAKLARKKVCQVSTDDIRQLMTLGTCEQWSDSTIQKEVALLKAAFNSAIREWRWKGFVNPCLGLQLGKSNRRFVVVTDAQMERLVQALSECDNPQFWPLVDLAIHTTLRQDSLLSLKWSQTNLETRRARVWGKGKWLDAQLPLRAVEILAAMPRGSDDRVFTMTQNAVNMAWEGVREKAELPALTFRDLRHVGATQYAKAGLGVHALMHLLGHTTTRMAEVYVNLARSDVLSALDAVDAQVAPLTPVPPTQHAHGKQKHPRVRKPAVASNVFHLVSDGRRVRAVRAGSKETGIEVGPLPRSRTIG